MINAPFTPKRTAATPDAPRFSFEWASPLQKHAKKAHVTNFGTKQGMFKCVIFDLSAGRFA